MLLNILLIFLIMWLALGLAGQLYGFYRTPHVGWRRQDWQMLIPCLLSGPFSLAAAISVFHKKD